MAVAARPWAGSCAPAPPGRSSSSTGRTLLGCSAGGYRALGAARVGELPAGPARSLGRVHGVVGISQQLDGTEPAVLAQRDADARAQMQGRPLRTLERTRELRVDAVRDVDRVPGVGDPLNQHRELVTAETGEHFGAAEASPQPLPYLDEHFVAQTVAERVIDLLEAVEVHEQKGQ